MTNGFVSYDETMVFKAKPLATLRAMDSKTPVVNSGVEKYPQNDQAAKNQKGNHTLCYFTYISGL
jgi:hypothetical protein